MSGSFRNVTPVTGPVGKWDSGNRGYENCASSLEMLISLH